jgi:hypothetical protein
VPTRKQRRRRQKLQRHEYEEVYIDPATGEEVEVDPAELDELSRKREPKAARQSAKPGKAASTGRTRSGRVVQPPSWERVLRRGAIFAPFMFATVYLLAPKDNRPIAGLLLQTLVLLAFFIPFSYFMDRFTYRTYMRRAGKDPEPRAKR